MMFSRSRKTSLPVIQKEKTENSERDESQKKLGEEKPHTS